jgi:hypothetical protein
MRPIRHFSAALLLLVTACTSGSPTRQSDGACQGNNAACHGMSDPGRGGQGNGMGGGGTGGGGMGGGGMGM